MIYGRANSAAPTLFHADLYGILRKLEVEGPKYFAGMRIYRQSGADPKKAANEKE